MPYYCNPQFYTCIVRTVKICYTILITLNRMALGRIEVTNDERDLNIHSDRVIGSCRGRFPNGTEFRIANGDLTVKELGAADFTEATSDEKRQVLKGLNSTFGEPLKAPRAVINDAGKFVLLDTAPPTELEASLREGAKTIAGVASKVLKATKEATKDAREVVGITGLTVRKNGMVSMARARLENGEPIAAISAELTNDFNGLPDLEHLVEVAIREAQDDKRNKAEDYGAVSQFKLDAAIVVRLEAGEDPDDIRNDLRPTLVRVPGRRIERSDGEVESILTIAFERAEALETIRANKAARAARVKGAVKGVVDYANEKVGNSARIVRENGMVTRARALLETGSTPRDITTVFETEFRGVANLAELTRVALKEAADVKRNKAAADALVKRRSLANLVADRLNMGENEDDIEANLRPDYLEYRTPDGFTIQRSDREVDEIMDSAISQGIALHEGRSKEKVGVLVSRARSNGMISMTRFLRQEGESDQDIREALRTTFAGTAQLGDLIETALREAVNNDHNLNAALVTVQRLHLDTEIANRLARGVEEADIRSSIESQIENEVIHGVRIERSNAERREILNAAFEGAEKINANRAKEKEANLIRTANEMGLVIAASYELNELGRAPDDVERQLIRDFPIVGIRDLARVAIQEAQDRDKVTASIRRLLQSNNEADRILAERAAGGTFVDICNRLERVYGNYTSPSGQTFTRCDRDMRELYAEANAQADALEANRAAEVVKARNAARTKNTVKAWVPGTEQAGWDKKLVDLGIIRFIRQGREDPSCDEDALRTDVINRLAGEKDPEGMADYALGRASDTNFIRKEAERVAFNESFDRMARVELGRPGATVGSAEAALTQEILDIHQDMNDAEARGIAQAAIRRAQNLQNWEDRGARAEAWARGPGWEGLKTAGKVGAVATGLLGLGAAALATVGTVLGLGLGWKALKFAGRTVKGSMPYVLPLGAAAVKTTLDATVGVAKFARNTALYAPATWIGTTFTRAYQGARAGLNFPTPARKEKPLIKEKKGWSYPFTAMGNLFRRTTTGTGNLLRGLWHRGKQAVLMPAALAAGLTVGFGEGLGKAGHHILGYEWNGSEAVDHLAEETSHAPAAPAPHGNSAASSPKAAAAAPAAAKHH